jgi:hypothetical protein
MYSNQSTMLDNLAESFVIPSYFPGWLYGFSEAEAFFVLTTDHRRSGSIVSSFFISQNPELHILHAILSFFTAETGSNVNVISRTFKDFYKYPKGTIPPIHYSILLSSLEDKKVILHHFSHFPLIGHRRLSFGRWYAHLIMH